jgi:phosphoglycerate dehydrogenase-like enzyme
MERLQRTIHMDSKGLVLVLQWLPDGLLDRLVAEFTDYDFLDAQSPGVLDRELGRAVITYGLPPVPRLPDARALRWIQLASAGVPQDLCPPCCRQGITVTNLAGLYGTSIAEHAFALMLSLARNLPAALRNQTEHRWDRTVMHGLSDLHGRTLGIIGLGNIGRSIARLGRAFGMRVVGCRRTDRPTPFVDQVYPLAELHALLAETDYLAVAAPLTAQTEGMLGPAEFAAMKRGVVYVNVSRGAVAQEPALLDALRSGRVAAAGLDVFAVEPLAPEHPLWGMPQVIVSPHYSGETINQSALPAERFARNLRAWTAGRALEGVVNLECGY